MKCQYCKKEIEGVREIGPVEGFILPNLIPITFVIGLFILWFVPWDIKHGYAAEYDFILVLGFMLIYLAYLILYLNGKVKGTFVLVKKRNG